MEIKTQAPETPATPVSGGRMPPQSSGVVVLPRTPTTPEDLDRPCGETRHLRAAAATGTLRPDEWLRLSRSPRTKRMGAHARAPGQSGPNRRSA